jgi:serine protease Do
MHQPVRRVILLGVLAAMLGGSMLLAHRARAQQMMQFSQSGLISELLPTVVNVRTILGTQTKAAGASANAASADPARPQFLNGSGFVIDPSGLIGTNYHVVEGGIEIVVTFSDGTHAPAKLVGATRLVDLAVLKVDVDRKLTAVRWADSNKVAVGDPVFAIGNPLGIGLSVSSGIVSALNRDIMSTPYDDFIQTDAAINHGNSGGPMFNANGEVIGVDTAIISPTSGSVGLGFAIPANSAHFVFDQLQTYGWLRPGWIGAGLSTFTSDLAEALGLRHADGAIVSTLTPGGPAEAAGLQVGDVILRYGDKDVADGRAVLRLIATTTDETVPITILRGDQELVVPVKAIEWPRQDYEAQNRLTDPGQPAWQVPADLGISLTAIDDEARMKYGLAKGQGGLVVTGVLGGSEAAFRGFSPGDVLLRVQNTPLQTPSDAQRAIDQARADKRKNLALLIVSKDQPNPTPKWLTLHTAAP